MENTNAIRLFLFQASQADLDDLKRRIIAIRFPEKETMPDNSQGVPGNSQNFFTLEVSTAFKSHHI